MNDVGVKLYAGYSYCFDLIK